MYNYDRKDWTRKCSKNFVTEQFLSSSPRPLLSLTLLCFNKFEFLALNETPGHKDFMEVGRNFVRCVFCVHFVPCAINAEWKVRTALHGSIGNRIRFIIANLPKAFSRFTQSTTKFKLTLWHGHIARI